MLHLLFELAHARNGDIQQEGIAGGDGLPETRLVSLQTIGDLSLIGNQIILNGINIQASRNINIIGKNKGITTSSIRQTYSNKNLSTQLNEYNNEINRIDAILTPLKQEHARYNSLYMEISGYIDCYGDSQCHWHEAELAELASITKEISILDSKISPLEREKVSYLSKRDIVSRHGKITDHIFSNIQGNNINLTATSSVDITGANITAEGQLNIRALGTAVPKETGGNNTAINISGVIDSAEYGASGSDDFAWATLNMPRTCSQ